MSGDMRQDQDQERFEDYLELEHFIEELQAGRSAHPPDELTPGKARIYRMAALFRSASPDEAAPRPEFAAELQARLEQEVQQPPKTRHLPFFSKKPRVSRRALLAGGAAVAASLAVGAGIERVVEQATSAPQAGTATPWTTPLVPAGVASTWFPVTTLAELGETAVPFATGTIVGFVVRNDGDKGETAAEGPVIAMSAACTHMGCIVHWQDSDRKFHCPCHGGLFTEYGKVDSASPVPYVTSLPRLETQIVDGKIYVKVPAAPAKPASQK